MSSPEKSLPHVDFSVRGPLPGMGAAVERILRALPAWFGIEAALQAYVSAADELDTFVLLVDRPACGGDLREVRPDQVIGFVTLRETSEDALEIHVMGVLPAWHRRGGGRALVERAADVRRRRRLQLPPREDARAERPRPGVRGDASVLRGGGLPPARGAAAGVGAGQPLPAARPAALSGRRSGGAGQRRPVRLRRPRPGRPAASARCTRASRAPCRAGTAPPVCRRPA